MSEPTLTPEPKGTATSGTGHDEERLQGFMPTDAAEQVAAKPVDELEVYRTLLETPKEFKNGFTWTTIAGAFFCGLLMMPGTIYLSLITGSAITASWVTLIIFNEISRRAMKTLSTQELVVLLYVANIMSVGGLFVGGPFGQIIFRQFFVTSDAVRDAGLLGKFPTWWSPGPTSAALLDRNLFHPDWLIPILLLIVVMIIGRVSNYTLGYFFFRLTSDVEKLPFPMAPVSAQGTMALAESGEKKTSWKWKVFSMGAVLGMIFALIQVTLPMVSGAILAKPITLIPLPWWDTTTITESLLPATPTGLIIDLGLVITGMVVPFWAVVGYLAATVLTLILNPILFHTGLLHRWQPGMDTVNATFSNQVDFWMSFGLGVAAAIAVISTYQTIRSVTAKVKEAKANHAASGADVTRRESIWDVPAGRGDFSPWIALGVYAICALVMVSLCYVLLREKITPTLMMFLIFFTFLYTPFISYVNARIIGICGQQVDIPFIREGAYYLSGFRGIEIWLAPIPVDNYGAQPQAFRINELTGTNFWSYVKADVLVIPLSLVLSFLFWAFIWHASAIPSESFPFAQKMWDLQSKQMMLTYSMTLSDNIRDTLFGQSLHLPVILSGFGGTIIAFVLMSLAGLPIMTIYGFLQVTGQMPHMFIPMIIGGFIGKFYFQKKFGQQRFLQMATVLLAGYGTGVGLMALIGVAIMLIVKAISPSLF